MKGLVIGFLLIGISAFAQTSEKQGTIKVKKQTSCYKQNPKDVYYTRVDVAPEFPGGGMEMIKWINKNLVYPPQALKDGLPGKIFLSFIIMTDGTITGLKILKSNNNTYNDEALRLVMNMPKWKPGECNGEPVPTIVNVPLNFTLK